MFIRSICGFTALGKCALGLIVLGFLLYETESASAQSPELRQAYLQGKTLRKAGRYEEAIPFHQKALKLVEEEVGSSHPAITKLINNLAGLYRSLHRYADAEPLFKRSLAIREEAYGPNHPDVASSLNDLAVLYKTQGRYVDAEPLYKRSLAIWQKVHGPDHLDVAQSLNNLGIMYEAQVRYKDAKPLFKRSLAIREKVLGPNHLDVAASLNNLAQLYQYQGGYPDAEPLFRRSLAIREKALGPNHLDVAASLNNLAELYRYRGRYADAEPLYKRSMDIRIKVLDLNHPDFAVSLNSLALLYLDQGRYDDAEPLFKKAIAIWEKALRSGHQYLAIGISNLAALYHGQGRYTDAEPLYKRSITLSKKVLGPDHPVVATSLNSLAELYNTQGRYGDAMTLIKRSLDIRIKALGPNHPDFSWSLNSLARQYHMHGSFNDALRLYTRALAIMGSALGFKHPNVAVILSNLANLYESQEQMGWGLNFIRRATSIHQRRTARADDISIGALSERMSHRVLFMSHVGKAAALAWKKPSQRVSLVAESFSVAQLARTTQAGAAVSRMGARFAAGDDDLAKIIREIQDGIILWQKLDSDLIKVVSEPAAKRNAVSQDTLKKQLSSVGARIAALKEKLATEFPDYAELVAAKPVPIGDVQKLLGPNEALIAYLVSDKKTYVWAIRQDRAEMFVADVGQKALGNAVKELRRGLDAKNVTQLSDIPAFNRSAAHKLFKQIFAPAKKVLEGANHVFVVADGALQSLPLGVLVTDEPQGELKNFSGYRQVPWLAKKYALTTLPSVSSLRALRKFAKRAKAHIPFTGFGDPVLKGHPGSTRGVKLASLYQGAIANVDEVRNLDSLPHTADELRALSAAVKGDSKHIYLRKAATEKTVKSLDLSNSRIVTFATHGLVRGELKNTEPALVLTPPEKGTSLDDGLLTASEVAQLKLNADLVILSACNTAAGDGTAGAEGLSGLAKAFFYAGTRALLVSHWLVESGAAVKLTTGMLDYRAKNPSVGRAEALQHSMLSLMNDTANPYYSHPIFWAPFVVVGEGGIQLAK
jgi:CHAT domain-containing protein/Tfp pilus assembly protein PilF